MAIGADEGLEDWLDFVVDTLKQLDEGVQGAFLKEFLLRLVSLEASEKESISHWAGVLARQSQLAEKLGRPVTLRTAAVDYLGELRILRSPILMEYDELRKLRYSAMTDPLTGLNNRRILEEQLHREMNRATRYGSIFSLMVLDLQKFKNVNDTYGHPTGDEILRSVARACLEVIRGLDMTCRTGGDEFAILLPQAGRSNAEALAERIAQKFKEYAHSIAPDTLVAIDYGIAIFPEDGHDAATLFASADKTLYANKHKGRGQAASDSRLPEDTIPPIEEPAPEVRTAADTDDSPPAQDTFPAVRPIEAGSESESTYRGPSGRRDERIRLEGSPALGVVRVGGKSSTVRLLNISSGGVCLLVDQVELPKSFPARLQVPLAPAGELTLHRIYTHTLPEEKQRVGCSFTPPDGPLTV
jgi:diguanylate cyclase (GGDEF)-like protein